MKVTILRLQALTRTLLALLLLGGARAALAAPVEVGHEVYDFLIRLEAGGFAPGGFGGTRPWDDREILARLKAARIRSAELHPWDARRLDGFLEEFEPEARRRATRLHLEENGLALFAGGSFWSGVYAQDSLPRAQRYYFGSLEPWIEAGYRERLYLVSSGYLGTERSGTERFTETYFPERGLPYNTDRDGKNGIPQGVSTFDGFRTLVGYAEGPIRIEAGQDWNRFGPGHWQHPLLGPRGYFWSQDSQPVSDSVGFPGLAHPERYRRGYRYPGEAAPMPQVRLSLKAGGFTYVKAVAQRDGYLPDHLATLVVHRLEWRASRWLSVGGTELVTLGGRSPDLVYWIPLVPLKFQEHQARGKDNTALSADVEVRWPGHGRGYAELALDDFSGPPLVFWGNKFSWTLGMEWQDPAGWPGTLRLEYAHVDQWVGTHHLPDRQLQHGGALLGSALPANSHGIWAQAVFPLPWSLDASAQYAFRQWDPGSRGSTPFQVFEREGDSRNKDFLGGITETRHQVSADLAWSWSRHVRFKAGAGFLAVENWKGLAEESLVTPNVMAELLLRY